MLVSKRLATVLLAPLACLAVTGCYNSTQVNQFLTEASAPVAATEYRVLPPDRISIRSQGVGEIDGISQTVRPDGKINLPLLGEVLVAGKTPKQIEEALKAAAKEYYEEVDATVDVTGYNSQKFYVLGQVSRPGPVSWTGGDTLFSALASSQPNNYAWSERIVLIRGDGPQEGGRATTQPSKAYEITGVEKAGKGNPRRMMVFNLKAMAEKGDMSKNVRLLPNDIIFVQPTPMARTAFAIEQIFYPVRAITDGMSDFRELYSQLKWVEGGMPVNVADPGRATIR
jgi:protein involved in polysaccharide export with SLBB domain